MSAGWKIDRSWTLFLDRDGVINKRLPGDYVKTTSEFEFLPGAVQAIASLSETFGRVIVVTNQQGIGKGIYTDADLSAIHELMVHTVHAAGGRIDAVFYAPHLASENSPMRKPGIGMAHAAQEKFPEISFEKSMMVGDTASDMQFAASAGMKRVFCSTDGHNVPADICVHSLAEFASYISGLKA